MAYNWRIKLNKYQNILVLTSLLYYDVLLEREFFKQDDKGNSFCDFINQDMTVLYNSLITIPDIKSFIIDQVNTFDESFYFIDNKLTSNPKEMSIETVLFYTFNKSLISSDSLFYHSFKNSLNILREGFLFYKMYPKQAIEFEFNKPLLFIEEAILLIEGYIYPNLDLAKHDVNTFEDFKEIYSMLLDSYKIKEINLQVVDLKDFRLSSILKNDYKVKPKDFLQWALKYDLVNKNAFKELNIDVNNLVGEAGENKTNNKKSSYTTPYINLMNLAIEKFWLNYDNKKDSIPLKKQVVAFLLEEAKKQNIELSENIAGAIDTIMRTQDARKGGLRKNK